MTKEEDIRLYKIAIETKLRSIEVESDSITTCYINNGITADLLRSINRIGELVWQVKETLNQLEPKLKTSDQKEESQEDQLEQKHSTPNNDQTLPEKEHKLKTRKTSKYQYIIYYPDVTYQDINTDDLIHAHTLAKDILEVLVKGGNAIIPHDLELTILTLPG